MNKEIKEILDKFKDYNLTTRESKLLLDYITNLQQENERLKEENNNKAMNDYAHAIDESWYRELYDDYKSRCEKAIEYIKEHIRIDDEYPDYMEMLIEERDDLLNILQNGGENDDK